MKITQCDYFKANRNASREAEIENHSHSINFKRVHASQKVYSRKRSKADNKSLSYLFKVACCLGVLFISVFFTACVGAIQENANSSKLRADIASVVQDKQARVGVAVGTDTEEIVLLNDSIYFPTLSVFKFHVALTVLDYMNTNAIPLDTKVLVKCSDLLENTYSPLRDESPNTDLQISIADLLKYSVALSDNNACDILIRYVGGPAVVDTYIKKLGVQGCSIVATEEKMHETNENQYMNRTKPSSMLYLMQLFGTQPLFAYQYQDFLHKIMIETTTGANKLKALLPKDVIVGHKTGSSDRTPQGVKIADNDVGFIYLPNGEKYYIVVFIMDSKESDEVNAAVIAEISKIVYDFMEAESAKGLSEDIQ